MHEAQNMHMNVFFLREYIRAYHRSHKVLEPRLHIERIIKQMQNIIEYAQSARRLDVS